MNNNNKDTKKKLPAGVIVLIVIAALLLVLLIGAFIAFRYFYGRANYVDDESIAETTATIPEEILESEEVVTLEPSVEESLIEEMTITETEETTAEEEKDTLENIYNLLLIGVDRRDRSWNGNSDAMILITINKNTKKIYMTSFMRDLYANIEGVGIRKLNHAYAIGAGPLLVNTLQTNYGVAIDNYASVDFESMKDIIDICGGVTVTIKDYEIASMKHYGILEPGTYVLNGAQALGYSRIRHYGNADFERTSRQRVVLQALIQKAKSMNALQLANLANELLPYTTHNLSSGQVLSLLTDLPKVLQYEIVELRIPEDGSYHSWNEILIPNDINETVSKLRATIYATKEE